MVTALDTAAAIKFDLPPELEAKRPPEAHGLTRDGVRMLVSYHEDDRVVHSTFRGLPDFLEPGDLVVVNDSATMPAALRATRENGDEIDFHFSTMLPSGAWVVEPRKVTARQGERITLPGGGVARLVAPYQGSARLWVAALTLPASVCDYLAANGRPIKYPYVEGEWPIEAYQTVYAHHPGSAEMPSAGRPFSDDVIGALRAKGIGWAALTLHTGVASLENDESPYEEWCHVPPATAYAVNRAHARAGRVVAIGTTVVRALESAATEYGAVHPFRGWTGLVITRERGVHAVDALLTGFHEPKATHLWMLEAVAESRCRECSGREHLRTAYAAALEGRYLWHEFGDVHLLL